MQTTQPTMPVSKITIGIRHRRDLGDIGALARDIDALGLLHPIVVSPTGALIAGARRLKAWQRSSHRSEPIPVHIFDIEDLVGAEWAENDPALRKNFTPSEAVAIKRAIEANLKPTAASQKGGRGHKAAAKISTGERAASFTGKSRRTIEKAEAIVDAAESDPKKFGFLQQTMDRTGRVDGVYRKLQRLTTIEPAAPARRSLFDVKLEIPKLGDLKAGEIATWHRFFAFLHDHASQPADHSQGLREFERQKLLAAALEILRPGDWSN